MVSREEWGCRSASVADEQKTVSAAAVFFCL